MCLLGFISTCANAFCFCGLQIPGFGSKPVNVVILDKCVTQSEDNQIELYEPVYVDNTIRGQQ